MGSRAIKKRHGIKKKNGKAIVLSVLAVFVALIAAGTVGLAALCASWLEDLPDYTSLDAFNTAEPSTIYATNSETGEEVVLAELQLENRTPVSYDEVSELVLKGTVATEDERFYSHNGVDLMGVARALVNNLLGGELEGASTITQQLVRNTILSDEMTDISFKRKIREMYIAYKLEEVYSKDEILLMYLNTINYGAGAYGIEAASERYFSKHASDLTIAEAATLVGIPQSPTYNSPAYEENLDNCLSRRNTVLDRMVSNNVVTQAEADAAKVEPIMLNETIPSTDGILAYPYFTSYVQSCLTSTSGYGFSQEELFEGGLKVYTTLDVATQTAAEEAAQEKLDQVGNKYEVSMVAIDPDNGHIKAMIGGKDYDTDKVNMATGAGGSGRQPGSSFKFFTLLAALEAGIDPETMVNANATVEVPGAEDVHNDSYTNWGTVSIAKAFEVSSNTAFIRLILSLGVDKVIDEAQKLGITSDLPNVAGLTLGIASVTPLEMAQAYAVVANGGTLYEAECIERVVDRNGNVMVDNSNPTGERVLSQEVSAAAVDVMKRVVTGTNGTGTQARLANGQETAGKTGTTESEQDSWFCGITPQYSVALWLGERTENYTDASPVYGTVTSVFSSFLNKVLADQPVEKFPTASKPSYKTYKDEKYDIGVVSASSGNWSSQGATNSSPSSSSSATTGAAGSSSSETSTGGTGGPGGAGTGGTGTGAGTGGTGTGETGGTGGTTGGEGAGGTGGAGGGTEP